MQFKHAMSKQGMLVYVYTMPIQSVSSGLFVRVGTRDECWLEQAGLAHAFEHMVFRGNKRLGNSTKITGEIEDVGGSLNAYTSKEATRYHNIVPHEHFEKSVTSLASLVTTPLFRAKDITKEMRVVAEEISRKEDVPASLCSNLLMDIIYRDHPLFKKGLGFVESVFGFTQKDFIEWKNLFYQPQNYIFVVVGGVSLDEAMKVINNVDFGKPEGVLNRRRMMDFVTSTQKRKVLQKEVQQATTRMGALIGSANSREVMVLDFFSDMIGGGMSTPLFQEVRDKRGLCYNVGSGVFHYEDLSLFLFGVGTKPDCIEEAISCIYDVIKNNKKNRYLFNKTKVRVLGNYSIIFCSPGVVLKLALNNLSFERPKSQEEIIEEVDSIKLSEVTAAVEKYLNPDNFSYAHIVPKGTKI